LRTRGEVRNNQGFNGQEEGGEEGVFYYPFIKSPLGIKICLAWVETRAGPTIQILPKTQRFWMIVKEKITERSD